MRMTRSLVSALLVGALAALGLFGCTSNDSASTTVAERATVKLLVKNPAPNSPAPSQVPVISGMHLLQPGWQDWQSSTGTGQLPVNVGQGGLGNLGGSSDYFSQFMTPVLDRPTPIVFPENGQQYLDLGELGIPAGQYDKLQVIWDQASKDYLSQAKVPFNVQSMSGIYPILGGLRADPGETICLLVDLATGEAKLLENGFRP